MRLVMQLVIYQGDLRVRVCGTAQPPKNTVGPPEIWIRRSGGFTSTFGRINIINFPIQLRP